MLIMPAKRRWYVLIPGQNPTLVSSYIYTSATPTCVNGANVCAIYAVYTNVGPSAITTKLQDYIGGIIVTGLAQPNGTGQKPYAYGRA